MLCVKIFKCSVNDFISLFNAVYLKIFLKRLGHFGIYIIENYLFESEFQKIDSQGSQAAHSINCNSFFNIVIFQIVVKVDKLLLCGHCNFYVVNGLSFNQNYLFAEKGSHHIYLCVIAFKKLEMIYCTIPVELANCILRTSLKHACNFRNFTNQS